MKRSPRQMLLCSAALLLGLTGQLARAAELPAAPDVMGPPDSQGPEGYAAQALDGNEDGEDRSAVSVELPEGTPADIEALATSQTPVTALTDALKLAYWTSPAILAQRAALNSNDYRIPQARAAYGPKLNYAVTDQFQRDSYEPSDAARKAGQTRWTTSRGWSTSAQAILTMPLFTFGRNFAQERYAVAQRNFQAQVLRSVEQQALLEAITAYVGVLRDRAGVTIARDNLDTLQSELADNQQRFKVREVTTTDVQQVVTRTELGRAQLYGAQRDAASAEADFVQKVGVAPGSLSAPNPLELPVRTLEEAYAYSEMHNPVLLAAHEREKISRAGILAAKSDLMPRVDFRGTALYASQSDYNDAARVSEQKGEFVLSGPIFESGLRQAKVAEAKAANDSDWRLIDGAIRDNRASLANSWNEWKTQELSIERFAAAVDSAQKALDGALQQERAGLITTLDVLELTRELLNARSNYNSTVAAAYIYRARTLALMGALEQKWLLPDVPRYEPQVHFDRVRHQGDVPLVTPLLRAIDGFSVDSADKRALRDPATETKVPAVELTIPPMPTR